MTDSKYVAFDVHQATISATVVNLNGKLITFIDIERLLEYRVLAPLQGLDSHESLSLA